MRTRRAGLAIASVAALGAITAPGASAAVTVGEPNLSPNTNTFSCNIPGGCTYAQASAASPIAGVVVRWRVGVGSSGPVTLKVIRAGNTGGLASTQQNVSPGQHYATRLPISAGDLLGFDLPPGFVSNVGIRNTAPGGPTALTWAPILAFGETRAPGTTPDISLLYNADVEPDADRDGFGDETQDGCPAVATTQGACPPKKKSKKCKKARRKGKGSAAAKKKRKCKKKKKKR